MTQTMAASPEAGSRSKTASLLRNISLAAALAAAALTVPSIAEAAPHGGHGYGGHGGYHGGFRGGRGFRGGGRWWGGRWYGYGVGSCWRWSPFYGRWIWACY